MCDARNTGRGDSNLLYWVENRGRRDLTKHDELEWRSLSTERCRDSNVYDAAGFRRASAQRSESVILSFCGSSFCGSFFLNAIRVLMRRDMFVDGNRWCIRADLMNSLPDEAIHKTVAAFTNIPERSGTFRRSHHSFLLFTATDDSHHI